MAYTIGDVEELTGVKAHVLRYWETVVPTIAPQKDVSGRRLYSLREIEVISRMKYLIEEKKFSIEGARKQILENSEIDESNANLLGDIHELRMNLTDVYMIVKKYRNKKKEKSNAEKE